MVSERCRFCNETDDVTKLVDPCDCYKKYDSLLSHPHCLEDFIASRKQSERDNVSDKADTCPVCGQKFRVKLLWRWTSKRMFSSTSLGMYFNFSALVLSCCAFFYSVYVLFHSGDLSPGHENEMKDPDQAKLLVGLMALIISVMAVIVLRKVYHRWQRHQMNAELVDVV